MFTHDSIGLGEDGPTHQPIEHLASLRAMPGMVVIRPSDANETVMAWRAALERRDGPTALVLTRQNLPVFDREPICGGADGLLRGGYVLQDVHGGRPDVILIGTGSEVEIALAAADTLSTEHGVAAGWSRCPVLGTVRTPGRTAYRESVLPAAVDGSGLGGGGVARSAGSVMSGAAGAAIGIDHFGASAPAQGAVQEFGITAENVVETALRLLIS